MANSLSAVNYGARQVECTINGMGERAGNASLEEIVMAVKTRSDFYCVETLIDTTQIVPISRLVSGITGFAVQPNKAIVGANAFAHEAGIHQDGILKHRETYEIMLAQDVGWSNNRLVLGKHSGRAAFFKRHDDLGIKLEDPGEAQELFSRFKELADKKHEIFDEDLHALLSEVNAGWGSEEAYGLDSLEVISKTGVIPTAKISLLVNGQTQQAQSQGSGPVDATFKAIEIIACSEASLQLYSVNAITSGTDSQGEVTVRLEKSGLVVNGSGADTDIVVASAKAYISALNGLLNGRTRAHPQANSV